MCILRKSSSVTEMEKGQGRTLELHFRDNPTFQSCMFSGRMNQTDVFNAFVFSPIKHEKLWFLSEHDCFDEENMLWGKGQVSVLTWLSWIGKLQIPGRACLDNSHKKWKLGQINAPQCLSDTSLCPPKESCTWEEVQWESTNPEWRGLEMFWWLLLASYALLPSPLQSVTV